MINANGAVSIAPLTAIETETLAQHEQVIERGLKSFIEVGNALLAIRDERLYRAQYGTFEIYCKQRWNLSRTSAYQFIEANQVVGNLSAIADILPANEAQARPLTSLEPEEQRIVWEVVQKTAPNGNVTASHVKSVADVLKTVVQTKAIDNGEGDDIPIEKATIEHVKAQITEETYERMKRQETYIAEKKNDKPHVAHNSGENEWYTPPEYIALARAVMGSIDCDPASSDIANKTVQATSYYTMETNGLDKEWLGNVWMNPPYSSELINAFTDKLTNEVYSGNTRQAIVLVNNATETQWFQSLMCCASAVCFPKGRVKFVDVFGKPSGAPLQGQAIIYIGENWESFIQEFQSLGFALYGIAGRN